MFPASPGSAWLRCRGGGIPVMVVRFCSVERGVVFERRSECLCHARSLALCRREMSGRSLWFQPLDRWICGSMRRCSGR
jgi:hypothetical protein